MNYEPKLVTAVANAFSTFDQDNSGRIEVREVGNVIRSLGVYPTEAEIRMYIMQMQKENASLYVMKNTFVDFMCEIIARDTHVGPTMQELEQAFLVLDPENKGFLDENTLRAQLLSQGERFSADEADTFISFAKDGETGQIDWRAYMKAAMEIMWKNQ
ncbi:Calmodulin [Hexamita inflata]|uniref:Calmodulin n=1 Tax=Hexamita inflata TaxID=28002 RepID=A0AA86P5W7_9EUKA|nr:Calmodulin [Hexamita inflata]CAI9941312.1 Calmodulin [Hexamita inflata]CAI9970265.1 Calmodulin [Hexamita inflata]